MDKTARHPPVMEWVCLLLLGAAFATIQLLIGGTRLVFSVPSYAILGLLGVAALPLLRVAKPFPSRFCLAITGAFVAWILIRACLSPVPYIAQSDIYSALAALIVYFFVACILTDARQRMILLTLLLMLGTCHVFVGALQFRDGNNFMPISWLQRYDYGTRASGFYVCPNHLAGLLEVIGIIGLSMACWSRWPVWAKMLLAYGVGVCYVGVILTGSRGGYLSTAASLFVFGLLSLAILRRAEGGLFWKIGGAGILVAIVIGGLAIYYVAKSQFLTNRAQSVFETSNMRVDLWDSALRQWKLQPFVGTGAGTFAYYGRLFRTPRVQQDPIYVHNDYLHLLAEYGALGAGLLALLLGIHSWHGGKNFQRLGPKRVAVSHRIQSNALALNLGAIAALSSYFVHSAFDFNLHIPANALLMAFVFGLLANDGVVREREISTRTISFSGWRLLLPLLGVVLLIQSSRLFPGEFFAEKARAAVRDGQAAIGTLHAIRGLTYAPGNPDLHFHLGLAKMLFGDGMESPRAAASFYSDAALAFERAYRIAPRDEIYGLHLAAALDGAARFDEAEAVFYDVLQMDPNSEALRRYYQSHLNTWRNWTPPPENQLEGGSEPAPNDNEGS
ncbi:MAG: O-antigen ligase family protein [Verrucomicrobiota bacterium]|nr:O-antigen ligase family protein [Verrucomicrobiota bacterium]